MIRYRLPLAVAASLMLGACATVGPDYEPPVAEAPESFTETPREAGLRAEPATELPTWWRSLNDPVLNELVDTAVANNLDLQAAVSRLRQARAQRGIAVGEGLPTLGTSAAATSSSSSENANLAQTGSVDSDLYSSGFDAGWEIDLFGGIRRSVEAADAELQSSVESLRDTLVSVLAEVSLNYVELRSSQARQQIALENLQSQQETLDLVQSQYDAGLVEELDLQLARSNVESTRAQLPSLATSVQQTRNRLATLLGQSSGEVDALSSDYQPVPSPPIEVAIGIPADVIRRRPDIRAAERQLAAATAEVGVATAELYPKLSLIGSIGLESLSSGNLFALASNTFAIGPQVTWRLFEGGQIRNQIEVQNALQQQAYIAWQSSVLNATEEVENAIVDYTNEQIRHHSLQQSAQAAARAAELARSRYDSGLSTFLEVLDAERSRLSAEDDLAVSNASITSNLVRLYKALGGGWESFLPAADEADVSD